LIVVIDQFDRPSEQSAFGVDVVAPQIERDDELLAFCATPPVSAMLKPTLIGSAARAGGASAMNDSAMNDSAAAAAMTRRSLATQNMEVLPYFILAPPPCGEGLGWGR
jgi:hypothetical protein